MNASLLEDESGVLRDVVVGTSTSGGPTLGALGMLNGILSSDPPIGAGYDEDGRLMRFVLAKAMPEGVNE